MSLDDIKKEKEEIKTNNKITENTVEKKPLAEDDDVERKEVTERKIDQKIESTEEKYTGFFIDKKPQNKEAEDAIEKRTDEWEDIASWEHHVKKRKREDGRKSHKKRKHKTENFDIDKSSQKKGGHCTRDDFNDSEVEEGEIPRRKMKKYRSPSPKDGHHEEGSFMKEIKKEGDDCTHPPTVIKQESPSVQGVYHCDICNLTLNGHITYQSHMTGKKHKKNLNAKNAAEAVVKSSVSTESPEKQVVVDFYQIFKAHSHPDPSKAGFYCSVCNSHSNSSSMWEAHIIGKRHIANLKKAPGIAPSKCQNVPAPPGTVARLKSQLKNVYEPIVGLDQIREIQRLDSGSVSYICFLCGGISICEGEIVDHILLTKHREKYLEKIRNPEFQTVRYCQMSVRGSIIAKLCESVETEQGRGEPEVYYAKDSLVKYETEYGYSNDA